MGLILGIDVSTTACSAAVLDGGRVEAWRLEPMERGQAERLNPMIDEVMAETGCGFAELALVAVTTGPGAFTGLRIGLACARAIHLAAGVPLAGVTTFAALASAVPEDERDEARRAGRAIVVCVEAKRRDVFVQRFDAALRRQGAPGALDAESAPAAFAGGAVLLAGDGAHHLRGAFAAAGRDVLFSAALGPPDARLVARLGAEAGPSAVAPRPFYIRPPDVRRPQGA